MGVEEKQHRMFTDEDLHFLVNAIKEANKTHINPEEHTQQHEVLRRRIENDNVRKERNQKIRTQVGGWLIIGFLGGVGKAAYHTVELIKDHWK